MPNSNQNTPLCPCCSGKHYHECCAPFHQQQSFPQTAEQLMRSRYAAFVLGNIDYIVQTTVPSQQPLLDVQAIENWGNSTAWAGLEILAHQPKISKNHATVEFNAFFTTDNGKEAHHELSLFVGIDGRWFFVDPTVSLPTNKQPCICGSGKKFKACCGIL